MKFWPFKKSIEPSVRDTIEGLIEEDEQGEDSLDPEEKTLLTNILNLRDISTGDIMIPRADIKAISGDIHYEDLRDKLSSIHSTRIPVYRGTLDDAMGYIHVKDILEYAGTASTFNCHKILKDILFVAPSMRLLDLLLQMKVTRIPMALVVDEYGGVDGLITTWDIIDKLLGDLSTSNTLDPTPQITRLSDQSIIADGRLPIETLKQEFSVNFQENELEEIETVGGLVFALAGRIPDKCELIKHPSGMTFEVLEVDARRVKKVRIFNPTPQTDHEKKIP